MSDNLPAAVIAYREYDIPAPGGGTANIAFTLRRAGTAPPGDFAPRTDARAHGLVSLVDYPGAPRHPAMWEQSDSGLRLTAADQDRDLSPEISQLIARYLAVFFNDVAAVAPDLAAVRPRCAAAAPSRAPAATAEQADSGYPRLEEHIRRYEAESESARFFYKSAKYVEWACISLVPAAALVHGPTAAVLGAIVIVLEGLQPLNGWHHRWITARWTAGRLRHEKYCYLSRSGQYAGLNDQAARRRLALTVEGLLPSTHAARSSRQGAVLTKQDEGRYA